MTKTTPEGKLKAQVKEYLTAIGAYHYWPVPAGYGAPQVDCIGCHKGRYFAIETKVRPRRATPNQLKVLQDVQNAGGIALVAYDLETVKQYVA